MPAAPTFDLACALIARPSVTPEDGGCLELIAQRLQALDFRIERMDFGKVKNLWARRGEAAPVLCLAGHVDVVPPGPLAQWNSDPFTPVCDHGQLHGRGAADMKSSLAAFVVAVERFVANNPAHAGSIAFLLTSDEEGDATDGTVRVVELLGARNEHIDYCIVGEPTSSDRLGDTIKNGRRGSLGARLRIEGIQGHVAYPQLARNPVHQAAPALAELVATQWDQGDEYFPPTTFQISNINAGTGVSNVIPGCLELMFNLRFSPASEPAQLRECIEAILNRHGLSYTIEWSLSGMPYLTRRGPLVAAAIEAITEATGMAPELSTSGGTSDGRFIARICNELIEFGPLNATIHKANECVAIAELEPLSCAYQGMLARLLTAPARFDRQGR